TVQCTQGGCPGRTGELRVSIAHVTASAAVGLGRSLGARGYAPIGVFSGEQVTVLLSAVIVQPRSASRRLSGSC
ncbi:MAG: hypothetical protein M3Q08_17615, partial [Pseudomonadota bacterium]|nr:hypothetical protein [Pseudomonadota bacterium]